MRIKASPSTSSIHNGLKARDNPTYTPTLTSEYLPLTTIFTRKSHCKDRLYNLETKYDTAFSDYSATDTDCWPTAFASLERRETSLWYSPGVCPHDYTIASQTSVTYDREVKTLAYCCPTGGFAVSSFTRQGLVVVCASYVATPWAVTVDTGTVTTSALYALNWPISVQWAVGDLGKFTPGGAPTLTEASSASTSASATSKSSATRTATSTTTNHTASGGDGGGLTTGIEAGIGAGAGAVVFALLGFLIWFIVHRRNKRRRSDAARVSHPTRTGYTPVGSPAFPKEMAGHYVHEMPERRPGELYGSDRASRNYGWNPGRGQFAASEIDGRAFHEM